MSKNSDETPDLREELAWNNDNNWVIFIESLTPIIEAIAAKYTEDWGLREDAVQNAKIELLHVFPEEVRGYEDYVRGEISTPRWQAVLRSYCLNVCRNEILTTLSSYTTGNIYIGRTQSGKKGKVRTPARYISLDSLIEESGLQISEHGDLSWDIVAEGVNVEEDA